MFMVFIPELWAAKARVQSGVGYKVQGINIEGLPARSSRRTMEASERSVGLAYPRSEFAAMSALPFGCTTHGLNCSDLRRRGLFLKSA